jgi:hypothetical protein
VLDYLKAELEASGKASKQDVIEAASRCFVEKQDLELLYKATLQRIQDPPIKKQPFPNFSARAICRALELREHAPDAMRKEDAETFVKQVVINLEGCIKVRNFDRKFFQLVKLFLYLLRFREKEQLFLIYDNDRECELFDRILCCLRSAHDHFQNEGIIGKARKVLDLMGELRKYMSFEGSEDILEVIDELAELDDRVQP